MEEISCGRCVEGQQRVRLNVKNSKEELSGLLSDSSPGIGTYCRANKL